MLDDNARRASPGGAAFCLVIMARTGEGSSLEIAEPAEEPDWSVETMEGNASCRSDQLNALLSRHVCQDQVHVTGD